FSAALNGGDWRLLPHAHAKTARARSATVHAGGCGLVLCSGGGPGLARASAHCETLSGRRRQAVLRGHSRWLLVHFQSQRLHLFLHVAALHVAALSFRSTDAPRLAFPDSVVHHQRDRKSTRLNSSHVAISYAVFCLKK